MSRNQHMIIRNFREPDLYQIAEVLLSSFQDKFALMKQFSHEQQIQLLIDASFIEDHTFDGYLVAESEGKVVGVMLLKWRGQQRGRSHHGVSLFRSVRDYGAWPLVQLFLLSLLLKEGVTKDECYIEHIAVTESARGLGIGTALLAHSLWYTKETLRLNWTSLYVASSNTSARSLYERVGFKVHMEKRSWLTQLVLHERTWIHMRLDHDVGRHRSRFIMKSGWWLGFIGFLGIPYINNLLLFFKGEAPALSAIGVLWFLMFSLFIPEERYKL
jgi:ribosomal protein S18 acetylase RimI-like enzyme